MFKVSSRNIRKTGEICSKLAIRAPERRDGVFIVTFEHIPHFFLMFLLRLWTGKYFL